MEIKASRILITGANRGIGKAFAEMCASEKAHLYLLIRKSEESLIDDLKKKGAASVTVIEGDLTQRSSVESAINKLKEYEIDILFNNAGLLTGGLLESQSIDDIYNLFQVNITALVQLTHGLLPGMLARKKGKIINHSSVSAIMHFPCATTYAASKAAVWAFTNCLQQEVQGTGVSTLCLFTPGVKTRMFDKIDELYSKNIETPKETVSPEQYSLRIKEAILHDLKDLKPTGATGLAFQLATHVRPLFNLGVQKVFNRQ